VLHNLLIFTGHSVEAAGLTFLGLDFILVKVYLLLQKVFIVDLLIALLCLLGLFLLNNLELLLLYLSNLGQIDIETFLDDIDLDHGECL
jgi:hypothetical protein